MNDVDAERATTPHSNSNEDDNNDDEQIDTNDDDGDDDSCKPMTMVTLTMEQMAPYFEMPLQQAAANMHVSASTLNRSARALGLAAWPYRRVKEQSASFLTSNLPAHQRHAVSLSQTKHCGCQRKTATMHR
jgi:hypothetical protein